MSYLQNFSRHDALHSFVCKLECELYRNLYWCSLTREVRQWLVALEV